MNIDRVPTNPRSRTAEQRSAGPLRSRRRRWDAVLLTIASVLGLWLGFTAPAVSPVTPPPAVVQPSASSAPAPIDGAVPVAPG